MPATEAEAGPAPAVVDAAPTPDTSAWPAGFLWGVSTSAYQIEGGARDDGRGPGIWDTYVRQRGRIANGDTGDVACDHYHRHREDIALMRELGVGAYRFSVAWPRVLPRGRGATNAAGLDFYDRLIDDLLAAGIEPWLCLYHWDLPQALQDLGGWEARDSAGWFADYAALVARRYGDRVKHIATFNEPGVFTLFGFVLDWQAPGIRDRAAYLRAMHHVNLAHGAAVDVLRDLVPGARIGAIHNRQPCVPLGDQDADRAAARMLDACWNRAFPDVQIDAAYPAELAAAIEPYQQAGDLARICRPLDWFGLNHYSPIYARADATAPLGFAWCDAPATVPRTAIGWGIDPESFRDTLLDVHRRYRLPIYVTENGTGDILPVDARGEVADHDRIAFLRGYVAAMGEALAGGADVRGYFVWSLLDNFEWGAGYSQRFGLVHVDYATQRRIPKASARWYAGLIRGSAR
ncbi:MAG: beta-glucosidase [Alphaproteobacteria bacterium]|nr:beta-glucosidase [Alphaproteobacteria bacterium]